MYRMPCGCEFKESGPSITESGLPSIEIDFYNLPDCHLVWDMLGEGYSRGVFQLEKGLGKKWVKELKPKSIDDLSALSAIIRPGTLDSIVDGKSLTQKFVDRKNGKEEVIPVHESLRDLLKETQQILVYQEQVIKIAGEIAGFTLGEADYLRKGIGSKDAKIIQSLKKPFLDGCKKIGKIDEKSAEILFGFIESSSRYSFNKSITLDTIVETPNGKCEISQIKPGDFVYSSSGFHEVLNIFDHGEQYIFKLKLASGHSIKCTMEHKFKTSNGIQSAATAWLDRLDIFTDDYNYHPIIGFDLVGKRKTIDLEIDHPSHLFFANGIETSNSHSVSYGSLAYATAYAKVHFPTLFFTSYLQHAEDKIDKQEEIRGLIDDMKNFSIHIAPPKLTNKIIDNYGKFWIIDENIQFGLASIKGLGKSSIKQLYDSVKEKTKKLNKDVKDFTWIEFLCEICSLNKKTVINNLIFTGASPDNKVSRKRKAYEYKFYQELTDRDLKWINENYKDSLVNSLKEYLNIERKDGGPATSKRKDQIIEIIKSLESPSYDLSDPIEWIVNNEKELLGTSISYNIMDSKNIPINYTISDFLLGKKGNITIGAEITSLKETLVKNGNSKGKKMAFIGLRDTTGSIDAVIFSDAYLQNKPFLFEGNTIICSGKRSEKGSFIIERVQQI